MNSPYLNYGLPMSPSMGFPFSPSGSGNLGFAATLGSFGAQGAPSAVAIPAPSPVPAPSAPTVPNVSTMVDPVALKSFAPGSVGVAGIENALTEAGAKPGFMSQFFGKDGFNLSSLSDIASIIGGFGMLWNGMQANKLAKDALGFQKQAYQKNLANQTSSYNLSLEDRAMARYAQNNRSADEAQAFIDQHKLKA